LTKIGNILPVAIGNVPQKGAALLQHANCIYGWLLHLGGGSTMLKSNRSTGM
jgi:hypothetical protein